MAKRILIVTLACAATLFCALNASATTVSGQSGSIFVNNGAGFVRVSSVTEVAPSSEIMVSPGGSALLTYADNCAVRVPSGIWQVQQAHPCAEGVKLIDFTKRMNEGAPPADPPSDAWDSNKTTLIVGGLAVAGGVAAAIYFSQNGGHHDVTNTSGTGGPGGTPGGTGLPASP
jgi:hypothetical protein